MRPATILIIPIGLAWLCIARLAFAQPHEGRAASVSAPKIGDLAGPTTSATGGSSGTADDSSGPPRSRTDWEQVPETNSEATSGGDAQVLEVPQSADAAQAVAPNNRPAQASNEGQEDESGNAPNESGALNGYLGENADLPGGYYIPVPVPAPVGPGFGGAPMETPAQPAPLGMGGGQISPPFPGGGFRPTPPIISRPGGFAGIPSTSPMLTPPLGSSAMPDGWSALRTH